MKISEKPITELFKSFQDDIITMTQHTFANMYPHSPEPIVFIATTNEGTAKMVEANPKLAQNIEMATDGVMPYDPNDEKLSVLGLPLGPFFQDTGSDHLNYAGKVLARTAIWKAINTFEQAAPGSVLFVAFISECWVRSLNGLSDEEQEYIAKHGINHIHESKFDKKEAFALIFESKDGSCAQQFLAIERNDDDQHQFLYRRNPTDLFGNEISQDQLNEAENTDGESKGLFTSFFKPFDEKI